MKITKMNKTCPDCGKNLTEQRWERGADGKKFHAYRHEVKGDCKFIEWINDEPIKPYIQKPTQQDASQIVAMRELYLLVKAAYIILMGKQTVPPEEALKWLEDKIVELKEKK